MKREIDLRVDHAEAKAKAAKDRVNATVQEIRHRLDPRAIAVETAESAFSRVTAAVEDVGSAARSRPWLLALGATLFGLATAARAKLKQDQETNDETNG